MVLNDLKIKIVPIDSIIPYDNNPRLNEEAVDTVADSITNYGFKNPIIVDAQNVIICGHTRRLAAMKLGLKEVPVIVARDLSPEKVKAFRLDDNKTAEMATWDFAKLQEELFDLKDSDYDVSSLAFGQDELDRLLKGQDEVSQSDDSSDSSSSDDQGVEYNEESSSSSGAVYDSVKGGIYKLGDHRLVCGDCCEGLDIAKLLEGDGETPVDLWLTDPPYNVNYVGRANKSADGKKSKAIRNTSLTLANDNMAEKDFEVFISKSFQNCISFLEKGASYYIFHAHTVAHILRQVLLDNDTNLSNQLIWCKNHFALGWGSYLMKHEPIYFGWKNGAKHRWFGEHNNSTTTCQKWKIVQSSNLHPSMKPVDMLEFFIRNSSEKGDIVLDTFGGSGSTLIACENTGRICRMMELMPKYCDAIRKRWAEQVHGEGCKWQELTPKTGMVENIAK